MGKKRKKRSVIPALIFLGIWLVTFIGFDVSSVSSLLLTAGISFLAAFGASTLINKRRAKKEEAEAAEAAKAEAERKEAEEKAKQANSPYSPEVQAIIREGRLAMKEMGRLYKSIQNPEIRSRINEIMSVSDKIVRDAIDDPGDVPQIRKFLDYYLPTTIKLLNTYDRMSAQEISGENITGSMQRIEDMLDTAIEAYKKQLDALFANQAADIQMDIEIMNGMLAREGLGGKSYLDLNSFMKQYEKQQQYAKENNLDTQTNLQKGSTSNG